MIFSQSSGYENDRRERTLGGAVRVEKVILPNTPPSCGKNIPLKSLKEEKTVLLIV